MERKQAIEALSDADKWLRSAKINGKDKNYGIGLYCLEMATEIALKAILVDFGIEYPKTHNILVEISATISKHKEKLPVAFVENRDFILDTLKELLELRGPASYGFSYNTKILEEEKVFSDYEKKTERVIELSKETLRKNGVLK